MPVSPALSLQGNLRISNASTSIDPLAYKRGMYAEAEIGKSTTALSEPVYKRNLSAPLKVANASTLATRFIKKNISSGIEMGRMRAKAIAAAKMSSSADIELGSAKATVHHAKKEVISAGIKPTDLRLKWDGRVALNTQAAVTLTKATARLGRLHRKIVPPPPSFGLSVQTSAGDVPLQGATLYAGSSYRLNLRGRGYYLGTLLLPKGPQLLFKVSTGLGGGDSTTLFSKSTHQPLSGIGIDEVIKLNVTDDGDLEEIHGQIRIYPEDTHHLPGGRSQYTLYWELQMVDPLSERPEPLRGTLNLVP